MSLANPILLWSLLGLSVPIAIHLLSRKEGRVIKLGSIRHVQETSTQQFKGIKLNELLLLVLRCVLIFIFGLLLSGLRCTGVSSQKWVVVETGLENKPYVKSILDSLRKEGYEPHQLRDDFPVLTHDTTYSLNYWKLIDQLREKNLSDAVVLSSSKLENFRGKRVSLPANIKWLAVPLDKIDFPVEAIKLCKDSVYVRTGHSSAEQTFFTTEKTKSASESILVSQPDSVRILIAADDTHSYDRRILIACLKTIQKSFPAKVVVAESSASIPENCDWIFWLSDANISEKKSASTIVMHPNSSANLIDRVGPKDWLLTKRLNEEVALDQNLTVELAHLIIPFEKQQEIVQANDRRTMPDSMAWSSNGQLASTSGVTSQADSLLIICLIVLVLIERIVAHRRNQ